MNKILVAFLLALSSCSYFQNKRNLSSEDYPSLELVKFFISKNKVSQKKLTRLKNDYKKKFHKQKFITLERKIPEYIRERLRNYVEFFLKDHSLNDKTFNFTGNIQEYLKIGDTSYLEENEKVFRGLVDINLPVELVDIFRLEANFWKNILEEVIQKPLTIRIFSTRFKNFKDASSSDYSVSLHRDDFDLAIVITYNGPTTVYAEEYRSLYRGSNKKADTVSVERDNIFIFNANDSNGLLHGSPKYKDPKDKNPRIFFLIGLSYKKEDS